jgi:hypothetical protein
MVIFASILGLGAGVAGVLMALGINIVALPLSPMLPSIGDALTISVLARGCGVVAMLLGVFVLIPERRVGASLMFIGAAGLVLTFPPHPSTATTAGLGAVAAALAIYSDKKRGRAYT